MKISFWYRNLPGSPKSSLQQVTEASGYSLSKQIFSPPTAFFSHWNNGIAIHKDGTHEAWNSMVLDSEIPPLIFISIWMFTRSMKIPILGSCCCTGTVICSFLFVSRENFLFDIFQKPIDLKQKTRRVFLALTCGNGKIH